MRQTPDQGPPAPERIEPEPEKVKGPNFPYRGYEQHGVESESEPWPEPGTSAKDNHAGYQAMDPIKEHDPIPVTIVTEYGRELRKWRTSKFTVTGPPGTITQLAGRNVGRVYLSIQNNNALPGSPPNPVLRISDDPAKLGDPTWGWLLQPAAVPLVLQTEDPVYATVENWFDPTWDVRVVVLEEYRVEA